MTRLTAGGAPVTDREVEAFDRRLHEARYLGGLDRLLRIRDAWEAEPPREFPNYAAGSWGPKEADAMLEREGRRIVYSLNTTVFHEMLEELLRFFEVGGDT